MGCFFYFYHEGVKGHEGFWGLLTEARRHGLSVRDCSGKPGALCSGSGKGRGLATESPDPCAAWGHGIFHNYNVRAAFFLLYI